MKIDNLVELLACDWTMIINPAYTFVRGSTIIHCAVHNPTLAAILHCTCSTLQSTYSLLFYLFVIMCSSFHSLQSAHWTEVYILFGLHCGHCELYSQLRCAVHIHRAVLCTLHTANCTLYTANCTLQTVHCTATRYLSRGFFSWSIECRSLQRFKCKWNLFLIRALCLASIKAAYNVYCCTLMLRWWGGPHDLHTS